MQNSTEDISRPEKFRFVGFTQDSSIVRAAERYSNTYTPDTPPELERNRERDWQLKGVCEAVLEFARDELGVDVSKRIPSIDRFHFFDANNWQKFVEMHNLPNGSAGYYLASDVYISEQATTKQTLYFAQHELIHLVSSNTINLCRVSDDEINISNTHTGYQNLANGVLGMVDEALTEMTNLEIMSKYWSKQAGLSEIVGGAVLNQIGYAEQVIVFDALIDRAANGRGESYLDIFRELQKGKFLGEMQALRVLAKEVGSQGMKVLARWTVSQLPSEIAKLLNLHRTQEKIRSHRRGFTVQVMEEVSPNITFRNPY